MAESEKIIPDRRPVLFVWGGISGGEYIEDQLYSVPGFCKDAYKRIIVIRYREQLNKGLVSWSLVQKYAMIKRFVCNKERVAEVRQISREIIEPFLLAGERCHGIAHSLGTVILGGMDVFLDQVILVESPYSWFAMLGKELIQKDLELANGKIRPDILRTDRLITTYDSTSPDWVCNKPLSEKIVNAMCPEGPIIQKEITTGHPFVPAAEVLVNDGWL